MNRRISLLNLPVAIAVALAISALTSRVQSVIVTGTPANVPSGGLHSISSPQPALARMRAR